MVNNTVPKHRTWLADHATADKAIVALHLMRISRDKGTKGVGPNRDDLPLFNQLVEMWSRGNGGPKDAVMRARARVQKYRRQLEASPYIDLIRTPTVTRQDMIAQGLAAIKKHQADIELYQHIREQETSIYGHW